MNKLSQLWSVGTCIGHCPQITIWTTHPKQKMLIYWT